MSTGTEARPQAPLPPPQPDGRWRGLRALVGRIHFYAGLFVGPFLLVAAVTGLLYTAAPQIERWAHADALTAPVTGPAQPVSAQVAAATATQRGLPVTEIRPSPGPGATTRVSFDAGLPEGYFRTVFVDPSTATVRATLDTYGEWLPVRGTLDELHRSLMLGDTGRIYTELAASWLGVLALSGLVLQLGRRVKARRALLPSRGGAPRARLRSWHGAVGVWASAGFLFLAATGLTWSQYAGGNVTAMREAFDWSTPSVAKALPVAPGVAGPATGDGPAVAVTAQRVLDAARGAGIDGPVEIVPRDPGKAWSVQQTVRSWPERQDSVAVAPGNGQVTDRLAFADWPIAAKLARWGVDAHMGILFGVVNQLALAALACGLIVLVVWGYRMWWLRRPHLPRSAAVTPSAASVALLGGVAVLAGLAVPLLGISLVAFLVLDGLLGLRRAPA
ncbi:PepSY-associated TM helix domain-containing protein [Pseudonocardia phyllosphaerae]|uniref:PepSY-associated TM helix domain-containing protein n=1 Tax=Pseudonocardia phyllosphaerae TaxID=3390502 RepID=UPI00397AC046